MRLVIRKRDGGTTGRVVTRIYEPESRPVDPSRGERSIGDGARGEEENKRVGGREEERAAAVNVGDSVVSVDISTTVVPFPFISLGRIR